MIHKTYPFPHLNFKQNVFHVFSYAVFRFKEDSQSAKLFVFGYDLKLS